MNYQSAIFSKYLSDKAMLSIISDEALIQYMLYFEIALAKAQAKLKIIPTASAIEIETVLSKIKITPKSLAAGTLQNGIPVITLLSLAKEKLSADAKQYLHYGATSQDVMDTAQILILKDAMLLIEQKIKVLVQLLKKMSAKYGKAVCMARTRGQLAMPTTFGNKINNWLQPLQRQLEKSGELKKAVLKLQFGGAVGTLSVYGNKAKQLSTALGTLLKLPSALVWHTQRDSICMFTNWLATLSGILGKMGTDILVMSQSEINEVIEKNAAGGGKSSAMPHKNNPVLSEALVALARINATLQSQMLQSLVHVNERDATAWILEWNALPQMLINTSAALNHAIAIGTNIKVDTGNMKKNVDLFLKSN